MSCVVRDAGGAFARGVLDAAVSDRCAQATCCGRIGDKHGSRSVVPSRKRIRELGELTITSHVMSPV